MRELTSRHKSQGLWKSDKTTMKHRNRKFYALALFSRIQGTTVRICSVNSWFASTRKRDAEREAAKYNKEHECSFDAKFCAVEVLG